METNNLHYEFTGETIEYCFKTLHRIRATKDIPTQNIKVGDLGGWVEKRENLQGNAWVHNNAKIYDNAIVRDNARVYDKAEVSNEAEVFGNARIYGFAEIYNNAQIYDNARVYNNAKVYGYANIFDNSEVCDCCNIFGDVKIFGNAKVYGFTLICDSTKILGNAYIGSEDDFCFFSNFGRENRETTFFKTKYGSIVAKCGCFYGTIDEFIERVKETHKGNKYEKEYLAMVELVKIKFNLE